METWHRPQKRARNAHVLYLNVSLHLVRGQPSLNNKTELRKDEKVWLNPWKCCTFLKNKNITVVYFDLWPCTVILAGACESRCCWSPLFCGYVLKWWVKSLRALLLKHVEESPSNKLGKHSESAVRCHAAQFLSYCRCFDQLQKDRKWAWPWSLEDQGSKFLRSFNRHVFTFFLHFCTTLETPETGWNHMLLGPLLTFTTIANEHTNKSQYHLLDWSYLVLLRKWLLFIDCKETKRSLYAWHLTIVQDRIAAKTFCASPEVFFFSHCESQVWACTPFHKVSSYQLAAKIMKILLCMSSVCSRTMRFWGR